MNQQFFLKDSFEKLNNSIIEYLKNLSFILNLVLKMENTYKNTRKVFWIGLKTGKKWLICEKQLCEIKYDF